MKHKLLLRKTGWSTCYLDVYIMNVQAGVLYGAIRNLKTDEIVDADYGAPMTDDWVNVLTVEEVLKVMS